MLHDYFGSIKVKHNMTAGLEASSQKDVLGDLRDTVKLSLADFLNRWKRKQREKQLQKNDIDLSFPTMPETVRSDEEERQWLIAELTKLIGDKQPHSITVLATSFPAVAHRLLLEQAALSNLEVLNYLYQQSQAPTPKPHLYTGISVERGIPKGKFSEAFPDSIFGAVKGNLAQWLADNLGTSLDEPHWLPATNNARRLQIVESYLNSSRRGDNTVRNLVSSRLAGTDRFGTYARLIRLTELFDLSSKDTIQPDSRNYVDMDVALQRLLVEVNWTQSDNDKLKAQLESRAI